MSSFPKVSDVSDDLAGLTDETHNEHWNSNQQIFKNSNVKHEA
jgi:hypothetical protein